MHMLGGMNLNILGEHRRTMANEYLSMLAGNGLFPLITEPTRITQEISHPDGLHFYKCNSKSHISSYYIN